MGTNQQNNADEHQPSIGDKRSPAERKAAFTELAEKNKANFELHKKLISKHLEGWNGLKAASLLEYTKTAKVSDFLHLALMQYAEEYSKLTPKRRVDLADSTKFLNEKGIGPGTNITTGMTRELLRDFANSIDK